MFAPASGASYFTRPSCDAQLRPAARIKGAVPASSCQYGKPRANCCRRIRCGPVKFARSIHFDIHSATTWHLKPTSWKPLNSTPQALCQPAAMAFPRLAVVLARQSLFSSQPVPNRRSFAPSNDLTTRIPHATPHRNPPHPLALEGPKDDDPRLLADRQLPRPTFGSHRLRHRHPRCRPQPI